jgi:DNA-binding FadR family transcriptional regulator
MPRLHREKLETLLDRIVGGEFGEGELLPTELELADELNVSRGVAREVFRALEERGVLIVRHGSGARVAPAEAWDVLDPVVLSALLRGPDGRAVVLELVECRALLEIEGARLAAGRATAEGVAALEELLRQWDELPARAHDQRGDLEIHFHRLLMHATANRSASAMLDALLDGMSLVVTTLGRRSPSLDEHRRVVSAFSARDGATAADAMREHLAALGADFQRARLSLVRR